MVIGPLAMTFDPQNYFHLALMNRSQRIVLTLYCVLVVYCCTWVPWHISGKKYPSVRVGYGWLWAGPLPAIPDASNYSDIPQGYKLLRPTSDANGPLATPDYAIIALRLLAITAFAGAALAAATLR